MRVAGASHVSFSIADLDRSLQWYRDVFSAEVMFDEPGEERRAAVLRLPETDLLIGLCEFRPRDEAPFDPKRLGLDHFAFAVASRDALAGWAARFDDVGVDHSGVIDIPTGAILNFKDPDGIALALMWRKA